MARKQHYQWDDEHEGYADDDTLVSRSQKKRDSTALQELGEALSALAPSVWQRMPLSDDLREALNELRTMQSFGSRRRHMQYIGRLMREEDNPEAIRQALADHRGKK